MIKRILIIVVNALFLIAFIICIVLSGSITRPLTNQRAHKAWAGQSGKRFAQISVFFPESSVFDDEAIFNLHANIDSALLAASIAPEPGQTLYTDAWSAEGDVFIIGERGSTSAKVIGAGGDFFLFHPLYLRDGSYLYPDDIMKDRVVLDEELAWRLFGSARLAGFEILINNRPFTIAGVIARENDFASSAAYSDGAGLFMSYDALMAMTDNSARINCYEIVLPDPITGFAAATIKEALSDTSLHIVENSARFSLGNSFAAIASFGERSMRTDAMMYPYWENAARYAEDWLALLLALSLAFLTCPVVFGVIYSVKAIRFFIKHGRKTFTKVIEGHDNRMYEKYLLEHHDRYNVDSIIREVKGEEY